MFSNYSTRRRVNISCLRHLKNNGFKKICTRVLLKLFVTKILALARFESQKEENYLDRDIAGGLRLPQTRTGY